MFLVCNIVLSFCFQKLVFIFFIFIFCIVIGCGNNIWFLFKCTEIACYLLSLGNGNVFDGTVLCGTFQSGNALALMFIYMFFFCFGRVCSPSRYPHTLWNRTDPPARGGREE